MMVRLTSPIDQLDTYPGNFAKGSRVITKDGNEYIYLDGTTSVAKYDWVYWKTESGMSYGSVTRLVADAIGPVGIAQAAIISNKCGWFLIRGVGWGNSGGNPSAGTGLYACGTAATVDDQLVEGDFIIGASTITAGTAGGTVKVTLNYPNITNTCG